MSYVIMLLLITSYVSRNYELVSVISRDAGLLYCYGMFMGDKIMLRGCQEKQTAISVGCLE